MPSFLEISKCERSNLCDLYLDTTVSFKKDEVVQLTSTLTTVHDIWR